jgi:hypothetical protein
MTKPPTMRMAGPEFAEGRPAKRIDIYLRASQAKKGFEQGIDSKTIKMAIISTSFES